MADDPRKLLLCYDGSERAGHAIAVTGRLFPGGHVHVLNVWEPLERIVARYSALGPYFGDGVGDADSGIESESMTLAEAGVKLAKDASLEATAHTASVRTTVWEAVCEAADVLDADVIITGTRALRGVREVISNTLSHSLIQNSKRAVLAIPMPGEKQAH